MRNEELSLRAQRGNLPSLITNFISVKSPGDAQRWGFSLPDFLNHIARLFAKEGENASLRSQ